VIAPNINVIRVCSMDPDEYTRMGDLEETMWWYWGLHANVLNALTVHGKGFTTLLDAGCGTGGMLKAIRAEYPDSDLHGVDISEQACIAAREKSGATVTVGSVDALDYPQASFDVLVNLDVLGYELDLEAAVSGFYRALRPGGSLLLNLAAYQWMLSYHDRNVGQTKRFTRSEAIALLKRHGFEITFASYWNTVLFPLMVARRKLSPSPTVSDVTPFHPMVNALFRSCLAMERWLLDRRVSLPFGGSIFIVAKRPVS
jgi:SAM-dependent methyltransferase